MLEAAVLLDDEARPIHWHAPTDRTAVALPDSRSLWDIIWANRKRLYAVAHTHPHGGPLGPSTEDITTFQAIEEGIGRSLEWYILDKDAVVAVESTDGWKSWKVVRLSMLNRTSWAWRLRALSYDNLADEFFQKANALMGGRFSTSEPAMRNLAMGQAYKHAGQLFEAWLTRIDS